MYVRLPAPHDALEQSTRSRAIVESAYQARKVRLSKRRRDALDRKIQRLVDQHQRGTSSLRSELKSRANFLDAKPESMDFPFGPEASSSIDIRLAQAYVRSLRSQFIRSVFSDPARTYV